MAAFLLFAVLKPYPKSMIGGIVFMVGSLMTTDSRNISKENSKQVLHIFLLIGMGVLLIVLAQRDITKLTRLMLSEEKPIKGYFKGNIFFKYLFFPEQRKWRILFTIMGSLELLAAIKCCFIIWHVLLPCYRYLLEKMAVEVDLLLFTNNNL